MKRERLAASPRRIDDTAECARTVRRLARRQETLRRRMSRLEEAADALALDLAALADELDDGGPVATAADRPGAPLRRRNADTRDALRRTAEAGAASLLIAPRSDGSADVRIDDGKSFTLSPALADLLSILAADRGEETDRGIVGWKTLDEVGRLLEKKTGRSFTAHAVTQQIYRLRREIFERGRANPWLVQTNRRAGTRFALRFARDAGRRQLAEPPV